MGKIRFILDEDLEKMRKSDNPAKMMVRLADGSVFEATVSAGKGSILNPMTKEEVIQKFRGFASAVFPDDKAEAIVETVEQLHLVDDIHDLTKMLVAG